MKINFRSFVYSMIMLMAMILSSLIALNVLWLGFLLITLLLIVPPLCAIIKKKNMQAYKFATIMLTSLLCLASMIFFFVKVNTWVPDHIESGNYKVVGYVDENYISDGQRIILLDELKLGRDKVDGIMKITVREGLLDDAQVGDRLEFEAHVYVRDLVEGFSVNASYLRSNIRYSSWLNSYDFSLYKGGPSAFDKINIFVKNKLTSYMGNKYGVIAYGILTGDKNEIASDVRTSFSAAGIAHILAVSGLHIGFLMAIITFIMRKLKVKRLPSFIINSIILLIYSTFAGFSPSVIRASIMFLVGSGAYLLGEQRDSFNSLGVAATCILTFSPLMLFEAGFIMSISAVFGIINFSPAITKWLVRIKLPNKIAAAIAVSTSAQLGILPACIYFFGKLQLYSVIINVLLMPLMSIVFMAVFVALVLSILPIFNILVTIAGYLVQLLTSIADACASLPYAQIDVYSSAIAFLMYPAYFAVGEFCYCKRKMTVSLSLLTVMFLLLSALLMM